ncbi:Fe-S cluster assembly sulfur transfer protein SufU [Actinotalea sp.]|uniref:Fe-S cluster assembly sulfur transfer protein SufU n=1 Tax=Actinotalea sp. TaxID=1872145 RepID=UPI002CE47964|nr:SUF system NifU family Fe-S cluster assembly protein [Actinotalea sp.]HQY33590.1 SUF system NifU family Fe-S cluster assembly protein [Actinotalea sp.]HRA51058.1 SUF system NifU family Fe-S cluster assembly protein [Actinotalea sp.]
MSSMDQLYQQLILEHAKSPHGKGLRAGGSGESFQVNPTCGDEVRLRVHLAPDLAGAAGPVVERVSWEGQGCSISQASLSVMADLVEGVPMATAEGLGETFRELMHSRGKGLDEDAEDALGDATAFTGVSQYPARIKCALLGWAALRDALAQAGTPDPDVAPGDVAPDQEDR